MENNYIVYMHISPSNKRYIGITNRKPNERWRNGNGYKHNKHFTNAINKYGWDNFEHIIIAKRLDKETACWLEIELIKIWDATNPNKGYNISLGGGGAYKRSEETKRKLSEQRKGKGIGKDNPNYGNHWSEEQRRIASDRTKSLNWFGENNPNYGNHWSEEQRKIASDREKEKGTWQGKNNPMYNNGDKIKGGNNPSARKIICLETMEIFECIKEAANKISGSVRLYEAIKKGVKYKGYTFMYYEDYLKSKGEIDI